MQNIKIAIFYMGGVRSSGLYVGFVFHNSHGVVCISKPKQLVVTWLTIECLDAAAVDRSFIVLVQRARSCCGTRAALRYDWRVITHHLDDTHIRRCD